MKINDFLNKYITDYCSMIEIGESRLFLIENIGIENKGIYFKLTYDALTEENYVFRLLWDYLRCSIEIRFEENELLKNMGYTTDSIKEQDVISILKELW